MFIFRDDIINEAIFFDVLKEKHPECNEVDRYFWRYKASAGKKIIKGNFAVSGQSIVFSFKEKINVQSSEDDECNNLKYDDLLIKNCRQKNLITINEKKIFEQVSNEASSVQLDFLANVFLNDTRYIFLDSILGIQHSYGLLSENGKFLMSESLEKKECEITENKIELSDDLDSNSESFSIIVDSSPGVQVLPSTLEAFEVFDTKNGYVSIDSNELGYRGEHQKGDTKHSRLFIIDDYGSEEVNYINTIQNDITVCDGPIPRRLWQYQSKSSASSGDGAFVAIAALTVEYEPIDRSHFKSKPLVDKDKMTIISRLQRVNRNDNYMQTLFSDLDQNCVKAEDGEFQEINCQDQAYFTFKGKVLTISSTDGYGSPSVKLLGILKINGNVYYLIKRSQKGGQGYDIVDENGKNIYVKQGDRPTMC